MRSATAEIAGESLFDLFQSRVWRLGQNGARRHDHPIGAVSALRGLLGDESGLEGARFFRRSQTFESRDGAARHLFDGCGARPHGLAIDQHRAGATLAEPATEFCAVQRERIAKNIEKRLFRIPGIDCDRAPVDAEFVLRHSIIICQSQHGGYWTAFSCLALDKGFLAGYFSI